MAELTKEMGILEVVQQYPQTAPVFMNFGMGCLGCAAAHFENIEQGDPVIVYTLPGTESPAAIAQDAARVVSLINSIGAVTLESEPVITEARKLYNALPPSGQAQVPNYELLLASEAELAAQKAQIPPAAPTEQPPQ